jgi:hypothetical protein
MLSVNNFMRSSLRKVLFSGLIVWYELRIWHWWWICFNTPQNSLHGTSAYRKTSRTIEEVPRPRPLWESNPQSRPKLWMNLDRTTTRISTGNVRCVEQVPDVEIGGSKEFRNGGILPQHHTATQPRRPRLEPSPRKPQISHIKQVCWIQTLPGPFLKIGHPTATCLNAESISLSNVRLPELDGQRLYSLPGDNLPFVFLMLTCKYGCQHIHFYAISRAG